jgi:hypothetical protein
MSGITQLIRPDLHVALDCPDDWTVIELDEDIGLRISDPSDPRVALQATSDDCSALLDETAERSRNGIPTDATCETGAFRRGQIDKDGQLQTGSLSIAALVFSVRDGSFVYRVFVAANAERRWTVRLETLQRKEWWKESEVLRAILESIVLL